MRGTTRRREQSGAAALEFALIVPILVVLLFGIISYGYMLSFRQALSQAAAEGARAAAVTPAGTSKSAREARALDAVNSAIGYGVTCASAGMTCSISVDVAADGSCASVPCVAKVELDYQYRAFPLTPIFPGLGISMPQNLVYEAVAEVS